MAVPKSVIDTLIAEAGSNPQGLQAVAFVIANRAREWGMTADEVVKQKGQFEGYSNPGPKSREAQQMDAVRKAAEDAWLTAVSGRVADPTGGALYFRAAGHEGSMPSPNGTVSIGGNVFARGSAPVATTAAAAASPPAPRALPAGIALKQVTTPASSSAATAAAGLAAASPSQGRVAQSQASVAKVRRAPISSELESLLSRVGSELDVYFEVTSGGQDATTGYVGSDRHNDGNAADIKAYRLVNGQKQYLDHSVPEDQKVWSDIIRLSVAGGAKGVGAGTDYMGNATVHIGFGDPAAWGAGGKVANAPEWVTAAWKAGLTTPPGSIPDVASERSVRAAPVPMAQPAAIAAAQQPKSAAPVPRTQPVAIAAAQQPKPTPTPVRPGPVAVAPTYEETRAEQRVARSAAAPAPASSSVIKATTVTQQGKPVQAAGSVGMPAGARPAVADKLVGTAAAKSPVMDLNLLSAGAAASPADVPKYITVTKPAPSGPGTSFEPLTGDEARSEQALMRKAAAARTAAAAEPPATVTQQILNPEWVEVQRALAQQPVAAPAPVAAGIAPMTPAAPPAPMSLGIESAPAPSMRTPQQLAVANIPGANQKLRANQIKTYTKRQAEIAATGGFTTRQGEKVAVGQTVRTSKGLQVLQPDGSLR